MTSIAEIKETPCLATIYPSVIARACAALDETPVFRSLPDGYLRIVVRIIKKINLAKLNSPIVASRSTIAKESGKSVETVQRAIKWLEDKNLVKREQKARVGLRGSSSPLIPTDALLTALQLKGVQGKPQRSAKETSPVQADCSISVGLKSTVLIRKQPESGFSRIDGFAIPTELAWLCAENELKPTALLSLMKLAKQAKQRLANVLTIAHEYVCDLRGRELYAYLREVIKSGKDFNYMAKANNVEHTAAQLRERLMLKSHELAGRCYYNPDKALTVTVAPPGMLTEVRNGRTAIGPINEAFLLAIEDGRLVAQS